jgi:polysaccharide export outer membrane protein
MQIRRILAFIFVPALAGSSLWAQAPKLATEQLRPTYVLGPNDVVALRVAEIEELSDRSFRIDGEGYINVPLLGRVQAGGRTVQDFEAYLAKLLTKFTKDPQVIVNVLEFRSEPVFFIGAFKAPGIYPLQGRRTLTEMLSAIGGLSPNAARRIYLTRRLDVGRIPLSNAVEDPDKKVSSVELNVGSLRENINPAEDLTLQPYDVVRADRAEMVYINGEVNKVGGFELAERESVSVLQLLSMAGGLTREARADRARVLRPVMNTSRRAEIPLNLKRVVEGRDTDFPLLPNDVLYVPRASRRAAWARVLYIAGPLVPTLIYLARR